MSVVKNSMGADAAYALLDDIISQTGKPEREWLAHDWKLLVVGLIMMLDDQAQQLEFFQSNGKILADGWMKKCDQDKKRVAGRPDQVEKRAAQALLKPRLGEFKDLTEATEYLRERGIRRPDSTLRRWAKAAGVEPGPRGAPKKPKK